MADRQRTHSHDCWSWGPEHYKCAIRKIETLASRLQQVLDELDAARTKERELRAELANLRTDRNGAAEACRMLQEDNARLQAESARVREALSDYYHQHRCGCGHPACKRCMDDRHMQEALATGGGQ